MPSSAYSLRMSTTEGPIVPGVSGSGSDRLVPSRVKVTDPFALPLMFMPVLCVARFGAAPKPPIWGGSGVRATFALAA